MRLSELIHLPTLLVSYSDVLVRRLHFADDSSLHAYWVASRARMYQWGLRLRSLVGQYPLNKYAAADQDWRGSVTVMREILLSEITTRVWCALLEGVDRRFDSQDFGPVGQSVLQGHLDARNRVLHLMIRPQVRNLPEIQSLNEDRRQFEHWCDLLLSQLPSVCPVDRHLSTPWHISKTDPTGLAAQSPIAPLLATGILASAPHLRLEITPYETYHRRVSDSILACVGGPLMGHSDRPITMLSASLLEPPNERPASQDAWSSMGGKPGMLGRF